MPRADAVARPLSGAAKASHTPALQLAAELNAAASALNNAPALLNLLSASQDVGECRAAVLGLELFFRRKLQQEPFLQAGGQAEAAADATLHAWLRDTYQTFLDRLRSLLCRPNVHGAVRVSALEALMQCVRFQQRGAFANELYARVLEDLLCSKAFSAELLGALASRYLKHPDVRFFTHTSLRKLCDRGCKPSSEGGAAAARSEDVVRNVFDVLCAAPAVFALDAESPSWCQWETEVPRVGRKRSAAAVSGALSPTGTPRWADAASQRRAFSEAWLSFLRLELPLDIYKKVLVQLHTLVLPHVTNPLLLSDFLTRAINLGSMLGMLALNGLFVLMTQHGLEYVQFYTRLYGLLEPGIFHARNRRQFFELLDVFLRSTHLPAYLVAAFVKRMARLALTAPPHGAMLAIGFAHNLLRRHPGCCVLVQRERLPAGCEGGDPFVAAEADPCKARALESSLWELDTLRRHYSPAVSRFVAVLDRDVSNRMQTADIDVAALANASYATLFGEDVERRLKAVPLAFYAEQTPQALWEDGWQPASV